MISKNWNSGALGDATYRAFLKDSGFTIDPSKATAPIGGPEVISFSHGDKHGRLVHFAYNDRHALCLQPAARYEYLKRGSTALRAFRNQITEFAARCASTHIAFNPPPYTSEEAPGLDHAIASILSTIPDPYDEDLPAFHTKTPGTWSQLVDAIQQSQDLTQIQKYKMLSYMLHSGMFCGYLEISPQVIMMGNSTTVGDFVAIEQVATVPGQGLIHHICFPVTRSGVSTAIDEKLSHVLANLSSIEAHLLGALPDFVRKNKDFDFFSDYREEELSSSTFIREHIRRCDIRILNGKHLATIHLDTHFEPEHGLKASLSTSFAVKVMFPS
jgi:hypothetical protein